MYFKDRAEAGELLANQLMRYRNQKCAVLALSAGGVQVGEQIARRLHCRLSMLLTNRITAPGDPSLVLGTIDQTGEFAYNDLIPAAQMEEYMLDFRGFLEEEKMRRIYNMTLLGAGGEVDRKKFIDCNLIIATDGLKNGLSFEAAMHFLKPVRLQKSIGAVPVGPAEPIERLNQKMDELHYLYIPDNFFTVGHYYENNDIPEPAATIESLNRITKSWI
jgi:putative phosphoribosyl transferase